MEQSMKGQVFNIQKFCLNDGPGIRTTVFLKGCPLNCIWCHNPESKLSASEIFFHSKKCTLCGRCKMICPNQCHELTTGKHFFRRQNCIDCKRCVEACFSGALESVGKEMTIWEVMEIVLQDKVFYENSGGGMTLSGGEPMMQYAFAHEILKVSKEHGLHTCMETCGYCNRRNLKEIIPLVDIFLFDYKLSDSSLHKKYTGVSNEEILQNLLCLDELEAKIILRCPVIPGINDQPEHFQGIINIANRLRNLIEINVEPYHPLGKSKAELLNKEYLLNNISFVENQMIEKWISIIQSEVRVEVKRA